MKIVVIGASGFLGAQIFWQATQYGYETTGTYASNPKPNLIQFNINDENTWDAIVDTRPDILIWSASFPDSIDSDVSIKKLANRISSTKFVYISSDITFCKQALASDNSLGEYARRKQREKNTILTMNNSLVFTVGPIYGKNIQGTLDKRTVQLLETPNHEVSYWSDVYKTFVQVDRLSATALANLDKAGHYFIGPPGHLSFYDFFIQQAEANNVRIGSIKPVNVSEEELLAYGQCRDLSYGDNPSRLWNSS